MIHKMYQPMTRWGSSQYVSTDDKVWIFTGSLTITLASVSAIGAALALAYFTCEHHHHHDDNDDDNDYNDDYDDYNEKIIESSYVLKHNLHNYATTNVTYLWTGRPHERDSLNSTP